MANGGDSSVHRATGTRAYQCWRSPRSVWREFHRDMSRGIPALRGGLMNNGCNAYWSYALFLFLADRNIRKYTRGRRGIEGCLRAVLRGGGDATQCWRAQQVVDICDGLLGKPVLSDLLKKYGQRGGTVDFSKIWHELGAEASGHDARLRNNRPDARVRDAIITGGIGRDLPIGPDTYR